jgi:hypothetical protein
MKFYIDKDNNYYIDKIYINKLSAIYLTTIYFDRLYFQTHFFKGGIAHNIKNASIIADNECKGFYLDNKRYGDEKDFTKELWRRFVKLQAFL